MEHGKRVHRKSFDIEGQAHALNFSCFGRQPLFTGPRSPVWLLESLAAARRKTPFDLWAFVVMPEHVHLVILPHPGVTISAILRWIKRPVTNQALRHIRRHCPEFLPRLADRQPNGEISYRFWQRGGGYDRNLRSLPDVHEKIKYVHDNPVRRGLVQKAEDWPWSSARAWQLGVDEPISLDRDSLPPLVIT
jgi:putative transposase